MKRSLIFPIEISEDHIRRGIRSTNKCPIALALQEHWAFGEPLVTRLIVGNSAGRLLGHLDEAGKKFISDFDDGLPVKPQTVFLEIPEADFWMEEN